MLDLFVFPSGPLRCIDDDYVELSVVLEKDIRAGRPTEPGMGESSLPSRSSVSAYEPMLAMTDIMQALEAACREVGGCLQAVRHTGFVTTYPL